MTLLSKPALSRHRQTFYILIFLLLSVLNSPAYAFTSFSADSLTECKAKFHAYQGFSDYVITSISEDGRSQVGVNYAMHFTYKDRYNNDKNAIATCAIAFANQNCDADLNSGNASLITQAIARGCKATDPCSGIKGVSINGTSYNNKDSLCVKLPNATNACKATRSGFQIEIISTDQTLSSYKFTGDSCSVFDIEELETVNSDCSIFDLADGCTLPDIANHNNETKTTTISASSNPYSNYEHPNSDALEDVEVTSLTVTGGNADIDGHTLTISGSNQDGSTYSATVVVPKNDNSDITKAIASQTKVIANGDSDLNNTVRDIALQDAKNNAKNTDDMVSSISEGNGKLDQILAAIKNQGSASVTGDGDGDDRLYATIR